MWPEATCTCRESRGVMARVSFRGCMIIQPRTKNAQTTKVMTFGPGAVWSLAPVCFLQLYLNLLLLRLQF